MFRTYSTDFLCARARVCACVCVCVWRMSEYALNASCPFPSHSCFLINIYEDRCCGLLCSLVKVTAGSRVRVFVCACVCQNMLQMLPAQSLHIHIS
jgi:hypothetical protein